MSTNRDVTIKCPQCNRSLSIKSHLKSVAEVDRLERECKYKSDYDQFNDMLYLKVYIECPYCKFKSSIRHKRIIVTEDRGILTMIIILK